MQDFDHRLSTTTTQDIEKERTRQPAHAQTQPTSMIDTINQLQGSIGNQGVIQMMANSQQQPIQASLFNKGKKKEAPKPKAQAAPKASAPKASASAPPKSQEPPKPREKKYEARPMDKGMDKYDSNLLPSSRTPVEMPSTTYYAKTEKERAPFKKSFDTEGKLIGPDKERVDTQKVKASHGKAADKRHIFTMDETGQFSTADGKKENDDRYDEAQAKNTGKMERFHHSSMQAGEAVAGAGEMQVRDGQVEVVSDHSGHYKPDGQQTFNTVKELENQKAGIEKIGMEFSKKSEFVPRERSTALEVLGYENAKDKSKIESSIRSEHGKKNEVMSELEQKVPKAAASDAQQGESNTKDYFSKKEEHAKYKKPASAAAVPAPAAMEEIIEDTKDYSPSPDDPEREAIPVPSAPAPAATEMPLMPDYLPPADVKEGYSVSPHFPEETQTNYMPNPHSFRKKK